MNNKINLTEDEAFNFSIVIAVYNSQDYLNECVDSIINQTLDFKQNTQIILVDDGSIDNSKEICLEYQEKYPNNILFLSKEHEGVASARNLGLEYARGKYVNFLDSDDSLSINALEEVYEFFEQNYDKTDVVSIPMFYFERENGVDSLNNKFNKTKIIDLEKEPQNVQYSLPSVFIKNDSIKENLKNSYFNDLFSLYQILLEKRTLGVIRITSYNYRKRKTFDSTSDLNKYNQEDYINRMKNLDIKLIDYCINKFNHVPNFVQNFLIYDLKYIMNSYEYFFYDTEEEKEEFFNNFKNINSYIDNENINNNKNLEKSEEFYLKNLKQDISYEYVEDNVFLKLGNDTYDILKENPLLIEKLEIEQDILIITGLFESFFNEENINIEAKVQSENQKKTFSAEKFSFYKKESIGFLSKPIKDIYQFNIKIPLCSSKISLNVNFYKDGNKNNLKDENIISSSNKIILSENLTISKDNIKNSNYKFFDKDYLINNNSYYVSFEENSFNIDRFYLFSIVMAIYNTEEYLNEAIDSVINQSIGFRENVQLILVNDGSTDNSEEICLKYQEEFPENIIVISQENAGQSSARNNGLNYVLGNYVNFLDSDDYLSENALEKVYEFFKNHYEKTDLVSIRLVPFGRNNNPHALDYKFNMNKYVDLVKDPNNPQLHVSSSFVKYSEIGDIRFPIDLVASEDAFFVNKILLKKKSIGILKNCSYYYRKREDLSSTIDSVSTKKEYYIDRLKKHFIKLISFSLDKEGKIPLFLQYTLAYDLAWLINDADFSLFTKAEQNEILYLIRYIMDFLDDKVITNNRNIKNSLLKTFLISLKRKDYHIDVTETTAIIKSGTYNLDQLDKHYLWLDIIEIKEDILYISGFLNSLFDYNNITIQAIKEKENGEIETYVGKYAKYTARKDRIFLGKKWQFKNNFDLRIPLIPYEKSKLKIRVKYQDENNEDENISVNLKIQFQKHARLAHITNYIVKDSHIIVFKGNYFHILPFSLKLLLYCEKEVRKLIKNTKHYNYNKALNIRLLYFILYPLMKFYKRSKKIYLYCDRIDAADDNATHLFKYSNKQEDNIKNYLILSRDCRDFKKLSKFGKVVDFKSLKHKLLYLYADKIISSHPYESVINPFFNYDAKKDERQLYNNLASSQIYFLQHGVTLGNISSWMSKFDHNLSLISTVSDKERESFFKEGYNYEKDIIQTLGFPRYDNLRKDDDSNQILIIPTWRKYLHGKKEQFIKSDYYNHLNNILNNEDLIRLTEKYGYKIVFKAHPELEKNINNTDEKYIDLLNISDKIKLSTEESYQELFNKSSLMITDYSSVFFDFAYLKKALIYYQPMDDYHYEESYFDFETMGFGDIINNWEDLIKKIEFFLENNCLMEEKYGRRVDDFFKYADKNNCKRVYDWIKEN